MTDPNRGKTFPVDETRRSPEEPTSAGEERETLRSILHDFAVAVDAGVGYDEAIDAYITRLLVWQARSSREGGKP